MVADFYFQLVSGIFGTLITAAILWMAVNTWKMTTKISAFDVSVKTIVDDITSMAADIKELRKYDAMLASHAVQIGGLDRRLSEITHPKRAGR